MFRYAISLMVCLMLLSACNQTAETEGPLENSEYSEPTIPDTLYPLNIAFKNETYYYAASHIAYNGIYGWATSDNHLKKVTFINFAPANALALEVDTQMHAPWMYSYKGYKMHLYNTTEDSVFFPAQDSRLYIVVQAQDSFGDWYYIEYMQPSWCGNSYHSLTMPPNYYWSLTVPQYEGDFKTKLRAKGYYYLEDRHRLKKDAKIIYSNEWEGSINPEQFCRLPEALEDKEIFDWYMERWNERFGKK